MAKLHAAVAAFVLSVAASSAVQGASDDFNDNITDEVLWRRVVIGTGPSLQETNQQLEITLPASSNDSGGDVFAAAYRTRCLLSGDFDVEVVFRLIGWPIANGVRVGLGPGGIGVVTRSSLGTMSDYPEYPREIASLDVGGAATLVAETSLTGKLRLVRLGNVWVGSRSDGESWVEIARSNGPTEPVYVDIAAWSHDYAFSDQDVRVAFDDFRINHGTGCDPAVPAKASTWGRVRVQYR